MSYYWLYIKDEGGRVQHTFLLEEASAEAAIARASSIDCGHAWIEVWDEERMIARQRAAARVAEPA